MYVKIKQVLPLQQRTYTDRNGQTQVFKSKGFLLTNGNNDVYAEAIGNTAERYEQRTFDFTQHHVADLNIAVREYTDKDGVTRYSNEITLTRLNQL